MSPSGRDQLVNLSRRSLVRTLRQPQAVVPALFFPLMFLSLIVAGAGAATSVPGFPADSYLDFAIAAAFVQGGLSAGINAGTDLAVDVESGFLSRLALTPVWRPALLLGQVMGSAAVAMVQGVAFLAVGIIFDVNFHAGVGGMILLVVFGVLVSLVFAGIGSVVALRTGSSEVVQGAFPLFFVLLMFSSFFLPRELITVDWFRWIATANPISYLIEGMRALVISGWDVGPLATGLGMGVGLLAVSLAAASSALRRRLA